MLSKNMSNVCLLAFRLVATPLVESNIQTMKVKQVQDQLKQMTMKAIESQTPEATPKGSPLHSPHPSPVFSEGMFGNELSVKCITSCVLQSVCIVQYTVLQKVGKFFVIMVD